MCVGGGGELALQETSPLPKGKDGVRKDMKTGSNTAQILFYFKTTSAERQEDMGWGAGHATSGDLSCYRTQWN